MMEVPYKCGPGNNKINKQTKIKSCSLDSCVAHGRRSNCFCCLGLPVSDPCHLSLTLDSKSFLPWNHELKVLSVVIPGISRKKTQWICLAGSDTASPFNLIKSNAFLEWDFINKAETWILLCGSLGSHGYTCMTATFKPIWNGTNATQSWNNSAVLSPIAA